MCLCGEINRTVVNKDEESVLYYLYSINNFLPYYKVSRLYKFDRCLKLNDQNLFQWVMQKALSGDRRSQTILGQYYLNHQNFAEAKKWFILAERQGDPRAKVKLSVKKRRKAAEVHITG